LREEFPAELRRQFIAAGVIGALALGAFAMHLAMGSL
jgi:hypothetical protein